MSHVTYRMSYVTCQNAYVDPRDMLNKFCFHVYAQSHSLTLTLTHALTLSLSLLSKLSHSHSLSLDMLNNFRFHVYAQKSLFIGEYLVP